MEKYVAFLYRYRFVVIITITLIVALLSLTLKNLAYEGSYKIWFDKDAKIMKDYEAFRSRFSGDDTFIVAFQDTDGIFHKKAVKTIIHLTKEFQKIQGVRKVESLSNYQYISSEDDDVIVEDFLYGDDDFAKKKSQALHDHLILDQLISKDATTTMIAISLDEAVGSDEAVNIAVFTKLQTLLKQESLTSGYRFYITGIPAVTASLVTISQSDAMVLMPLAVVVVIVLLFSIFRSVLGVLIPSVVVVLSFLSVLSIQILLGYKLNNFTVNIPSFMTAIAIADAMHLYLAWVYYKHKNYTTKEAVTYALKTNIVPMALTSFTTAVGFATLGVSTIEPIATLGIAITSGALIAFGLSITIAPAIILLAKEHSTVTKIRIVNLTHIQGYGAFIRRHDKKIVVFFSVTLLIMLFGMLDLKVDSNSIKYFTHDTLVRSGAEFVEKNLTGSMRYEVIVDAKCKEGVKDPHFLQTIQRFEKALHNTFSNVRFSTSLKDVVVRMQSVLNPDANSSIPKDNNLVAQYLLLYSMSLPQGMELNDKIDTTQRYLRVTINTNIVNSSQDLKMIAWIQNYFATQTPYSATVQGQTAIFAYMQSSVSDTLIASISLTLLFVTLMMLVIFKNIQMVGLFILPNVAPIIFVGGLMGYADIPVDIGIAISAAVILGIAVDDTIHFFSKYFDARKKYSFEESIDYILSHSGHAMILTTFILSVTFGIFGVSSFVPNVHFAIVTVSALNIALVFDLVVVPALLSLFYLQESKMH